MSNFKQLLEEISATDPLGPGFVLRRMNPEGPLDIYVGKELPTGLPVLRLKVPGRSAVVAVDGLSTACVAVERRKLPDDASDIMSVLVKLRDRNYLDHFSLVIDDFLRAVVPVRDSLSAWRMLSARLHSWLRFFSEDFARMSEERQRGLIGELAVLQRVAARRSWVEALQWWTGPDADDRDFRMERSALEVKARLVGDRDLVRITNEYQLELEPPLSLFLWVVTLQEDSNRGQSVVDWVRAVRTIVSHEAPGALARLEELLQKAGFSDIHFDGVPIKAYRAVTDRVFRVTDDMPRIVASQLPQGVGFVSYDLDLSVCSRQLVEETSVVI